MSHLQKSFTAAGADTLRTALAPLRDQLLNHPIYASVNTLPRLRCFMRYHVFAVWDFMCLAKRLQRDLTSLEVLWLPPARPALARFINSLILAEETDLDPDGAAASHFELYVQRRDLPTTSRVTSSSTGTTTDPPVCVRSPRQPRTTSAHGRRPVMPPHRRWPRASPCGKASTPSWRGSIPPTRDRDSAMSLDDAPP